MDEEVLDEVWPSEEEHEDARSMFDRIRQYIRDEHGRDARLMGSLAKRTFLSGDKDLDIFVFFDDAVGKDQLEEEGLAIGEDVFEHFGGEYEIEYAEHPYTKGQIEGFDVEIVPAYDIDTPDELKSSVDRTPLHTEWVNQHLGLEEKRDVVLLKAFLKGRGLYGSSLKVEGFSGYLCELLIAEYGGFKELLEAAVDWQQGEVIDVEQHHPEGLPRELEDKFAEDDLIVIDPTDPERNVAAVLSSENHARFIYQAWQYLREPERRYFFPPEPSPDREVLEEELDAHGKLLVLTFPRPDLVDDLLYPQLRKLRRRLEQALHDHEFDVFKSGIFVEDGSASLVFDMKVWRLPERQKHVGPQVFHNDEHLRQFRSKYDRVWVEEGRLATYLERDVTEAETVLELFLEGDLQEKGVPSGLVDVLEEGGLAEPDIDDPAWQEFLWTFLRCRS